MNISYANLWSLLEISGYKKSDLQKKVNISPNTMVKLNRNEKVSMDTILKICHELNCDISEVMELYQ